MKNILLTTIAAVLLTGCTSTKSLNLSSVSVGMDKQKVITLHGEPFRVAAIDGLEYFIYRGIDLNRQNSPADLLVMPFVLLDGKAALEVFIRFKDGKVEAYGRLGDFDSTKHKELLIKKAKGK